MEFRVRLRLAIMIALFFPMMVALAAPAYAQDEPYTVYDTRPVITEGPYLVATGETTATIVWLTDTPSHGKVRYGANGGMSMVAEPQVDGLIPVGTRHVVHLEDLTPGTRYSYEVVATRVVKLKAYWPDKGLDVRSGPHQFTTFSREDPSVSFSVVTDTHEDTGESTPLTRPSTGIRRSSWFTWGMPSTGSTPRSTYFGYGFVPRLRPSVTPSLSSSPGATMSYEDPSREGLRNSSRRWRTDSTMLEMLDPCI